MPDKLPPDVIIVGAGIAGASAALDMARAGIRFVGIDKAPRFGGTARGGGVGSSIAGSPMQKELGISDSWEQAVRDLRVDNDPDVTWARSYYRRAVADVYGWYGGLGLSFEKVVPHEGDSAARWHLPLGGGLRLMDAVWREYGALGVQDCWQFGTAMTDLLMDADGIAGIRVENAEGKAAELRARIVLLAAGGFGGNAEMGRDVGPLFRNVKRLLAGGNSNSQGQVHAIVAKNGGQLQKMADIYGYANGTPDYRDASGQRGVVVRGPRSSIWVNRDGARFHDEDMHFTGRTSTTHLLSQPDQTCWAIFDEAALAEMAIQDHYIEPKSEPQEVTVRRYVENSPYFSSADTLDALAGQIGLPAAAVARTLRDWNALLASGAERDPLTKRKLTGLRQVGGQGRWYAVQFFPMLRKTLGGVATDLKCRVLDKDCRPIPGLFAAGELTGMSGLAGPHPLEGLMAGGSLFTGRVAGRWAIREARKTSPARELIGSAR